MLLAEELNKALGDAGKSVVHSLSQAHCEWNLHPADRKNAAKADLYRWSLLCVVPLQCHGGMSCFKLLICN